MKNLLNIILGITLLFAYSCEKEDLIVPTEVKTVLNQSVSGNAFIDTDGDGVAESPMSGARVYLGDVALIQEVQPGRPDTFPAPYNEILWADVDVNGNYEMLSIPVLTEKNLYLAYAHPLLNLLGSDVTPDGDFLEEELFPVINCSIEQDESDTGNNFTAQLNLINGSISGIISIDSDLDGTVDGPEEGVKVWLSKRNEEGNPVGLAIENALTDANGLYVFNSIEDGEYTVSFASNIDYGVTSSGDASPDSDITPNIPTEFIVVDLIDGEHDSDNNYEIVPKYYNITGNVLVDNNEDGTGDEGIAGQRVEVYQRDSEGNPIGSFVAWSQTTADGYFRFLYLDSDEYVIVLVDDVSYECLSSSDLSPELGEPTSTSCSHILSNVISQDFEDDDNEFIIKPI